MNKTELAENLVKLANELISAQSFVVLKDLHTKRGAEFKAGTTLRVESYDKSYPYRVRLSDSMGQTLAISCDRAYRYLRGFPKPPSFSTMQRWSDDGVARAVDGARVESDGFSPSGAPSWLLAVGVI